MKILVIPCLEDNYSYLIIDESSKEAAAVDPVEPEKVLQAAEENGVDLKLVLTTHHHWDHAGGNEKIKQLVPGIKIYGGSIDNVKGCTHNLENGDKFSLGMDVNILSLHTPWCGTRNSFLVPPLPSVIFWYRGKYIDNSYPGCGMRGYGSEVRETEDSSAHLHNFFTYIHTKGHISYYVTGKEEEDPAVFTGDTLFVAGCGRFFEGTAEQMYQSLCVTLGSLPKPTKVYCGHEYTVKNLQFALTVEPDNSKIEQKLSWAQRQRQANIPTIPSTIDEEMETNPFMRVDLPELQGRVGCPSAIEAMREIRRRKDEWRG